MMRILIESKWTVNVINKIWAGLRWLGWWRCRFIMRHNYLLVFSDVSRCYPLISPPFRPLPKAYDITTRVSWNFLSHLLFAEATKKSTSMKWLRLADLFLYLSCTVWVLGPFQFIRIFWFQNQIRSLKLPQIKLSIFIFRRKNGPFPQW